MDTLHPLHRPPPRHRAIHHRSVVPILAVCVLVLLVVVVWRILSADEESGAEEVAQPSAAPTRTATTDASFPPRLDASVGVTRASPMEAVEVSGWFEGASPGATLVVQRKSAGGRWVSFPLRPALDATGRFRTFVELGTPGDHVLRVLDPRSGAASAILQVQVR